MKRYAELICNGLEVVDKKPYDNNLKSKMVEVALTNLAYNNSPEDLELYFLQVAKDDQFRYELLKHCKGCVTSSSGKDSLETLNIALDLLEYIDSEISRREKLVKNGLGRKAEDSNIHIYNKKYPDNKMPVLMLWIDEAASLYEINQSMSKEEKALRNRADSILKRIAQTGRYIGVYMVNVMQRASKDEMPRGIKINLLNKVSFNQTDRGASMVAIDHESAAIGLPKQVFAYKSGTCNIYYAKTPFSDWSKNLKLLNKQGKLRKDNDNLIKQSYSHWLNDKTEKVQQEVLTPTKITNEELLILENKLAVEKARNKALEEQINMLLKSKEKDVIKQDKDKADVDSFKDHVYESAEKQRDYFKGDVEYHKASFKDVKIKIKNK